jgi:hypothetical protein
MKREEIIEKMAKQFPEWKVEDISFVPWGAYIHATLKANPKRWHVFTIDF